MSEEKNQERILGSLLESSKTTALLANDLGYIDLEGYGNSRIILRDLKKLEENGYIKNNKVRINKFGRMSTSYSIIFSFHNLRNILNKYKKLVLKMQKNSIILENLLEANSDGTLSNEIKEDLKKMLQLSPSFFRYLLFDDDSKLIKYIEDVSEISRGEKHYELLIGQEETYEVVLGINIIFKTCVNKDLVEGCSSREAKEYVKQLLNKPSEVVIKIVLEHHSENKDVPDLRGKRVITVKTPKFDKIFQQNLKTLNNLQS